MELKRNQRRPLAGMTLAELQNVVAGLEMPKFVAKQIAQWLYVKRVTTFEEMTNISKANRDRLAAEYKVGLSKPTKRTVSQDGTAKYLFDVGDGKSIEAVYIPDEDRHTLCISSQKGCRMNCYFCMTGRQGFHGNLTSNQIINQVLSVPEAALLTNVVFMGMGEPLDNLDEVLKVIEILTEPWGMAWSPKRVTVSTVGKKPELKVLAEKTSVHIAVSVHNAVHDERESLMPLEKIYPIKDVMQMLGQYDFAHQRRLSVEYIMWQWFNDDIKHAEALREILPDEHVRVNLIRYHMIPDVAKLRTSSDERMTAFRDYLNGRGVMCTIRRSRGEDIAAACGMLAGKVNNAAEKAEKPEKAVKPAKAEKPAKATKAEKPAKATRASKKK
ncbi:MAG: 23S rRNA (adenine(2503)-C(2))-methyltransferase RlmN [Muribaculaceae bacterium]|nr:23S rRNA (adenine(2503)-C(2))-methyltransferase RlmN [Muribaculaceae bacterium]